ncbi:hypothetical protein AGMMS49992_23070 [Clostridia bacterium]|nr:hypothetical protein AGMMS49992_23070 [Clostridia bacterium]
MKRNYRLLAAVIAGVILLTAMPLAPLEASASATNHYIIFDSIINLFGGITSIPQAHYAMYLPTSRQVIFSRKQTVFPVRNWTRYDIVKMTRGLDGKIKEAWTIDAAGNITQWTAPQLTRAVIRQMSTQCDHQSQKCPYNYRVR